MEQQLSLIHIFQYQTIPRLKIVNNIIKMPVAHAASLFIENEQTRSIPGFNRCLCNKLLRELIKKVASLHECFQCIITAFLFYVRTIIQLTFPYTHAKI